MDFICGLPKSDGKSVILVVVDRLTKYAHFMFLSHPFNVVQVAQLFLDEVYKLHGLPLSIIFDIDPIFTGVFWKELMQKLDVKLNYSTSYHPQTDGQTERVNQCLETYLQCMVYNQQRRWHKWISLAEWWYNTTFHSSLKVTPFEALYGYPPPHLSLGSPPKSNVIVVDQQLKERHQMLQVLRRQLIKAQDRMRKFDDMNRSERKFTVGTWVYLKMQPYRQVSIKGCENRKLGLKYYRPFEIIEKVGAVAYKLQLPPNSSIHSVFHVSQLKARVGKTQAVSSHLPLVGPEGMLKELPEYILDRRIVKMGNAAEVQLLVKWSNRPEEDATWDTYDQLKLMFPTHDLRDKVDFKEGGMSATNLVGVDVVDGEEELYLTSGDKLSEKELNED